MLTCCLATVVALLSAPPTAAPSKLDGLYYLQVQAAPTCELIVSVNREVAVRLQGTGSGVLDVTNYVVNGTNALKLAAEGSTGEVAVTLIRARNLQDSQPTELATLTLTLTAEKPKQEQEWSFDATVPFAWFWQDGAKIGELSESDKKDIYAELQRATDALAAGDWRKGAALRTPGLSEEAAKRIPREWIAGAALEKYAAQERELFARVRSARLAPLPELRFLVGERLVRVETRAARGLWDPPEANVILAELAPERDAKGPQLTLGDRVVYLTKVGSRWHVLTNNWSAALIKRP